MEYRILALFLCPLGSLVQHRFRVMNAYQPNSLANFGWRFFELSGEARPHIYKPYILFCIYVIVEIKKWGNSLGIRLSRRELRKNGLKEGDLVRVSIEKVRPEGDVDLSRIPTFSDPDSQMSERHDRYLYGGVR